MPYRVYILECSDGSFYTGSATNVDERLLQHQQGVYPDAFTFTRRPVKLVWCSEEVDRYSAALSYERQVKGWSRAKKAALIRGDYDGIHEIVKEERKRRENHKKNTV